MSTYTILFFIFALALTAFASPVGTEGAAPLEKRARTGRVSLYSCQIYRVVALILMQLLFAGHLVRSWPRRVWQDQQGQRQDHRDLLEHLQQRCSLRPGLYFPAQRMIRY